jgi:ornithine carbamoyltransferase
MARSRSSDRVSTCFSSSRMVDAMTSAMGRDLLALDDLTSSDLLAILKRAQDFAGYWSQRRMPQSLSGKRIALIVDDGGWRNTTAFDLGVNSMGGLCVHTPLRLGHREAVADLANYLDNWIDAVVCRTPELGTLRALAEAADAPVINARTKQNHPCETLGDLAFYWHRHGTIDAIKVVIVAPDANILGSWIEAARVLPLKVVQVYPERWHVTRGASAAFRSSTDLGELRDADIVVTDCWPDGGHPDELSGYRITAAILDDLHREHLEFLPCPPVTRDQEVSADAMLHANCRVIDAKAFLLHAQNAALEWVFRKI